MELTTVRLDQLVPYWRNPRNITPEAVNAVAESIKRYGYRQPIVVDAHNVIVIGHTRYQALKKLGYEEAQVQIADDLPSDKIKQLRVADNRVGEYSEWDWEQLNKELADPTLEGMDGYFRDLIGSESTLVDHVAETASAGPSTDDADDHADDHPEDRDEGDTAEFICPACFHSWEQRVTESAIRAGVIRAD